VEVEERTVPGSLVALVGWRGRTGPPPAMEAPPHEVTAMEAQSTYLPLSLAGHHEGASGDGGRGRRDLVLVAGAGSGDCAGHEPAAAHARSPHGR
jgi:hypothetical protein